MNDEENNFILNKSSEGGCDESIMSIVNEYLLNTNQTFYDNILLNLKKMFTCDSIMLGSVNSTKNNIYNINTSNSNEFYLDSKILVGAETNPRFIKIKHKLEIFKDFFTKFELIEDYEFPQGHIKFKNVFVVPLTHGFELHGLVLFGSMEKFDNIKQFYKRRKLFTMITNIFVNNKNKLQTEFEEIKNINDVKDSFITNVSHEIRTPLNGIIGMITILSDTKLTADQRDCLDTMNECGLQLMSVVNDVLDYSKLNGGQITLEKDIYNIYDIIDGCVNIINLKADKKGLDINMIIDKKIPTFIIVDKNRLAQILINILSNAVTFTDKGNITIYAKLLEKKKENGEFCNCKIEFSIKDTGIGIPKSKLNTIFESFVQVNNDEVSHQQSGAGLGLAICKSLVTLMNGDIKVDSILDVGSVFSFTIECDTTDSNSYIEKYKEYLKDKKILVVDDNEINRKIIFDILIKFGVLVIVSNSARDALMYIRGNFQFDLCITDIRMPEMNGYELADEIKRLTNIPILGLSSINDVKRNIHSLDRLIKKPVREFKLIYEIYNLLVKEKQLPLISPSIINNDTKELANQKSILVVDDNSTNIKVCESYLQKIGCKNIHTALSGYDGIEKLENNKIDILLLDIKMPKLDGYQTFDLIKKKKLDENLITIPLTAVVSMEDRTKCSNLGLNEYITKPIDLNDFKNVIEKYL